ncbi:MAG: hypothetical protein H0V40_07370 [Actinobacteria bacterium]|nr:hypothetical protein [Actinomycetota bacterium]
MKAEPTWHDVLAAAVRLQRLLPDAVLVGGSAAAVHADHRVSFDDDHVLTDLKQRFDTVLEHLEQAEGWVTARVNRPVLILGSLDGIETGIRQLIRRRPLEIEQIEAAGVTVTVPTLPEMLRVKAWLILRRNATRDYLDFAALADRLGEDVAASEAAGLDAYYEDQIGPGGRRIATQLTKQLAAPAPYDLSEVDLRRYRKLDPRWQDWAAVVDACRSIARRLLSTVADEGAG